MFGIVTKFHHDKNYGFILGDNEQTYFIHQSRLNGEYLDENYYISFTPFQAEKGNNAKNFKVIEAPERSRRHGKARKKHARTIKSNATNIVENDRSAGRQGLWDTELFPAGLLCRI